MNLSKLHITSVLNIMEGYGKRLSFDYNNWHVDPTPNILQLGTWFHPTTGNTLVAGINLNYLTPQQVMQVREFLPTILKNRRLKARYWTGMDVLPDIFDNFYRTYDRKYINIVEPGTLRFLSPKEVERLGKQKGDEKLAQRKARLQQQKDKKVKEKEVSQDIVQAEIIPPETAAAQGREAVKTQQAQKNIRKVEPIVPKAPPAPLAPKVPPEVPPEVSRLVPKAPSLRKKVAPEAPEPTAGSGPRPNRPDETPEQEAGAPIPSQKKPPEEPEEEEGIVELPEEEV